MLIFLIVANEDLSKLKIDKSVQTFQPVRRRKLFYLLGVMLLVILAGFLYLNGFIRPAVSVEVTTVSQVYPSQTFSQLSASGYVVAQRKAAVASKTTGRLVALMVEEGSRIKEGQIIARLENAHARAAGGAGVRAGALLLLIGLLVPGGAGARHDWVGNDLCRSYPERMPPELGPGVLPAGQGSGLLGRYCGQCHFAPGPGQHTAREWVEVVTRMALPDGGDRAFAERSRPVAQPSPEERGALLAYLQEHALRPLVEPEAAPTAYRSLCGDCHAAPDPAAYPAADWPRLLTRMKKPISN